MSKVSFWKIVLALLTLITNLCSIAGAIYGIYLEEIGMVLTCAMLSVAFSIFNYKDYNTYILKKE